mgnify:CR=1 FL=1
MAQFYPIHEYDQTRITIDCADETFVAHGKAVTVPGWKVLYQGDKNDDEEEKGNFPSSARRCRPLSKRPGRQEGDQAAAAVYAVDLIGGHERDL